MGKKATKTEEKKGNGFKEFKFSGEVFEYSGRVFEKREGKGKVIAEYGVTLTLNDVFTLKGIKLKETSDYYFLTFPQFKSGEEYKSYVYTAKELNDELSKLADVIAGVVSE